MQTVWTKHIRNEKDKASFEQLIRNNTQLLNRLRSILTDMRVEAETRETKLELYDAGYPFKQAFLNGEKAVLSKLETLLDI